jgi:hypothetical protein
MVTVQPTKPISIDHDLVRVWNVSPRSLRKDGSPMTIEVKAQAIKLPEIGHFIQVPDYMVKDLRAKTEFHGERVLMTDAEGGEQIAKAVRKAIDDGVDIPDAAKLQAAHIVQTMEDDEFRKVLQLRGLSEEQIDALIGGDKPKKPSTTRKKGDE